MKIVKTLINEFDILITSALGLVTALAWNEAFKNYFQNHKTLKKYGPWIYAVAITIFSVLMVVVLSKLKNGFFKAAF